MTAVNFVRAALAYHFCLVAFYYTAAILADRARTGHSPVACEDSDVRQRISHALFRVFRAAILGVTVLRAFVPEADASLGIIETLMQAPIVLTGLDLVLGSFAWTIYVNRFMGQHWRSGVPTDGLEGPLLTGGPFAKMRHPMYLGVLVGQVGFFLALPSIFALVCLIVGVAMIVMQARREDDALASHFGDEYRRYASATPAFFSFGLRSDEPGPRGAARS